MIAAVAVLVLGIIITCIKVKETRFLGLSVIFAGLSSIVSSFHSFLLYYMGSNTAARLNRTIPYYVLLLTLSGYFFICFYVHRNYHKKFLYAPLIAIPVVGRLLTTGTTRLLNILFSRYGTDAEWSARTSVVNNLFSLIIIAAILIILSVAVLPSVLISLAVAVLPYLILMNECRIFGRSKRRISASGIFICPRLIKC